MGDFKAIADTGATLVRLLEINRKEYNVNNIIKDNSIILGSPADVEGQEASMTLFLYKVIENPYLKNLEEIDIGTIKQQRPPLTLDLYYLLTAYGSPDAPDLTTRTKQGHRILGYAMSVFYDNSILSGSILQGTLADSGQELKITLNPMSLDDMNKIWCTFSKQNFKPSVGYVVTPVPIESRRIKDTARIVRSETRYSQTGGDRT